MDQGNSIARKNASKILVIGGPTASGKSKLALALAREVPAEIINADSRQIYRRLAIGTGQPESSEFEQTPHHLYGFLEPQDSFNAGDFERHVSDLIPTITARRKLPILVGGTGFYIKAVLRGVWPVAPKNDVFRTRLRKIGTRHHNMFLHKMLQRFDPVSAASIAPRDTYRLIRALEIYFQTGVKRSELPQNQTERYQALKYYLDLPREVLLNNIEQRTRQMFARGWIQEVRQLLDSYDDFDRMPAAKSLGYREVIHFLRGQTSPEECEQQVMLKTRQYAKRQLTWFRNQDGFQPLTLEVPFRKILDSVLQWYGT